MFLYCGKLLHFRFMDGVSCPRISRQMLISPLSEPSLRGSMPQLRVRSSAYQPPASPFISRLPTSPPRAIKYLPLGRVFKYQPPARASTTQRQFIKSFTIPFTTFFLRFFFSTKAPSKVEAKTLISTPFQPHLQCLLSRQNYVPKAHGCTIAYISYL